MPEVTGLVERNSNSNHCVAEEIVQEVESNDKTPLEKSEHSDDEKYLKRKNSSKEITETEVKAEAIATILDSRVDLHASLSTQGRGFDFSLIRLNLYNFYYI